MDPTLTPIIVAFIMALPGLYVFIQNLRRDRIDSAKLALDIAGKLDEKVKSCEIEINNLKGLIVVKDLKISELNNTLLLRDEEIIKLKREISNLHLSIIQLENKVKDLNTRVEILETIRQGIKKPKERIIDPDNE